MQNARKSTGIKTSNGKQQIYYYQILIRTHLLRQISAPENPYQNKMIDRNTAQKRHKYQYKRHKNTT